jgi:hypothetical protein
MIVTTILDCYLKMFQKLFLNVYATEKSFLKPTWSLWNYNKHARPDCYRQNMAKYQFMHFYRVIFLYSVFHGFRLTIKRKLCNNINHLLYSYYSEFKTFRTYRFFTELLKLLLNFKLAKLVLNYLQYYKSS